MVLDDFYKFRLETSKSFRADELLRVFAMKHDNNGENKIIEFVCNNIIKYIHDLDREEDLTANQK